MSRLLFLLALPLFAQPTPQQLQDAQQLQQLISRTTDPIAKTALQQVLQRLQTQIQAASTPPVPANPSPVAAPPPTSQIPGGPITTDGTFTPPPAFPGNFVFLGASYNADPVASPNVNGTFAYGRRLNSSGMYSYTAYDAWFVKVNGKVQLVTAQRENIAEYLRSIGRLEIFGLAGIGIAETSSSNNGVSAGASYAGGGFGVLPIKGGFAVVAGARFMKSNVTPSNKTATVYELGGAYSWGN